MMKLLLLIAAICLFIVLAILGLSGGHWETFGHLIALLGVGLAAFAASFLPFTP
jgi:hypothetical protein